MRLGRTNLIAKEIASSDKADPALHGLHVARDGTTVAANGRMLMTVEPVPELVFPRVEEPKLPDDGITIPLHVVDKALSNLPKDKKPHFQQAAITRCDSDGVQLTTVSKRMEQRVAARPSRVKFPEWEDVLVQSRERSQVTRICVNRKDLIKLLQAMEKACPDPGNKNAIFIELGGENDPMLVRAVDLTTGQHAVGVMNPLDTGEAWLKENGWEKAIFRGLSRMEERDTDSLPAVPLRDRGRGQKRKVRKVRKSKRRKIRAKH